MLVGEPLAVLANKAERAGRTVAAVDPRNTSRSCPSCGHTAKGHRATRAKFPCAACGFAAKADHVGSTSVLNRAGPALCAAAQPPAREARAFPVGGVTSSSSSGFRLVLWPVWLRPAIRPRLYAPSTWGRTAARTASRTRWTSATPPQ
ncbi:zinc ribbon domain-containing protein [Streptomyces sp. NPDC049910]|uniref:zinc ribbon domain-containing protein n=1 Tax=Streptomyces sp. NPDC049910 TaxID=3155278 RepID=UPI00343803F4